MTPVDVTSPRDSHLAEPLTADGAARRLRWSVYAILIALAVGNMSGRILAVNSVDVIRLEASRLNPKLAAEEERLRATGASEEEISEQLFAFRRQLEREAGLQRPFLSGNDRSRWMTVRALVEHGTYEIDEIIQERNWDTIDMVQHRNRAGEKRLYSSKPPLLATLIAGPYWLIHKTTGATLATHPYEIGRGLLLLINVVPLTIMFVVLASLVERYGTTDWGKIFVMAAATWATFLNTFAVVLNNHLPGAVCVALTLDATLRIWLEGERRTRWFVCAGLFGALAVTNELPALAFMTATAVVLLWTDARRTLVYYLPAALVVAAAAFGTNYIAHASFRPAYAHWDKNNPEDNWYEFTYVRNGREVESYWKNPKGIDKGEKSIARYALHCTVGHHGLFSLTPVWLLSFAGLIGWSLRARDHRLRALAATLLLLSAVVFVFYLLRPEMQRNYGGMTSGLRWMFWFAPLWLLGMLPAADWLAPRRWGRALALVLLAFSVLSASFPTWNPWTQPYLARLLEHLGWLRF